MLIAVIGGKLQGVEAVYLAQKAGWKTLLIDKNPEAPAVGLSDQFYEHEFSPEHPIPLHCPKVDIILPAMEDLAVLNAVKDWAETKGIPLAFDLNAYNISSSKLKSNVLFRQMNLPVPEDWPHCPYPVVVKPDGASGSQGVAIFQDARALFEKFPGLEDLSIQKNQAIASGDLVVQEYIKGPSYSIEVMGRPGKYQTFQVTDLAMDDQYDCKRVTAPTQLSLPHIKSFEHMALGIARQIQLTGIMDLEVILTDNTLKLLEIDARLPSQTPMTVYGSTGINMVQMLVNLCLEKRFRRAEAVSKRWVVIEHIRVLGRKIQVCGEHIMAKDGPLEHHQPFFGANEAITSFFPGKNKWVATLIFYDKTPEKVRTRREECYEMIRKHSAPGDNLPKGGGN